MKILLLTRFLSAGVGGAEYVGALIAELLAKNGHQVWVITNKMEGITTIEHENIHTVFVSSRKPYPEGMRLKKTEPFRYNLSAIKAGLSIIKKEKIDIIHSNQNFGTYAGFTGSVLCSLTGVPHIMLIHHLSSRDADFRKRILKNMEESKINPIIRSFLEKFLIKLKCSAIHTVSESTRDDLIHLGEKKPIYVIPNAIPITVHSDYVPTPFQFVSISRLVYYKNLQIVIKALKIVKEKFPNVKLIVIGDGPYKLNLEKLVSSLKLQENVNFKNHVSENEKEKLIATSQAIVFPSLYEGFGMVILESFAQKRPVLVSNVRPMSDIVEHGKTGLVMPPQDEKEWAKAIDLIIQDPKHTSNMGEEGKKVLEEKYSIESMKYNLLRMYHEQIQNK